MGFRETLEVKQTRINSIRPDIEALKQRMDELGELNGEDGFIREAVRQACKAAMEGNYGVGAVVVHGAKIVARGHNRLGEENNPMHHVLHAEMDALRDYHERTPPEARQYGELCMYTTLEPCPMCTCGMLNAGVSKAVAGSALGPDN